MKVLFATSLWPTKKYPQYVIFLKQLAEALQNNGVEMFVCVVSNQADDEYILDSVKGYKINGQDYKEKLKKIILDEKFDLIDTHGIFDYNLIGYLKGLCIKNKITLVRHIHGLNVFREYYEKYSLYGKYLSIKRKFMYGKYDAMIGVSNKVCDIYKRGMKKDNAYTVYNGVDINKFCPLENKSENEKLELVCIANLIKIKGQDYLIKGLKLLKDDGYENFHLSLYGRGVEENNLRNLVDELGLSDYVEFKGYVEYDKVADHLKCSDIFIMPSYFEALGCVYLEAMASKVCTVGCENQGIAEIIEHGKNGLLVKEQDENSIFEVLKMLIDNPDKRKALAQAGYETVVPEFSWDNIGKKLKGVFENIIDERK